MHSASVLSHATFRDDDDCVYWHFPKVTLLELYQYSKILSSIVVRYLRVFVFLGQVDPMIEAFSVCGTRLSLSLYSAPLTQALIGACC